MLLETVTALIVAPLFGSMFWIVMSRVVERPGDVSGNAIGSGRTAIGLGAAGLLLDPPRPPPELALDVRLESMLFGTHESARRARTTIEELFTLTPPCPAKLQAGKRSDPHH